MKNSFLRPSRSVSQPKNSAPEHRAGEIGAGGEADVGVAELQHRARLQRAGDRAGQRHFEAVEDPGDAERGHHQGVKAAPRQPVEPRRNVGFDDAVGHALRTRRGGDRSRRNRRRVAPPPIPARNIEALRHHIGEDAPRG